jgi:protein ImuA
MATDTVRQLAERIRTLETSFRLCDPLRIPLASGLDKLFPDGGLSAGSMVELLPRAPGVGAWTFALMLARYACGERKTLLIADPARSFYPPAARKFGLDLGRTIIVRPKNSAQALLAVGQALRCAAIGTAIGEFDRLSDRDSRRLQLAAEAGGSIGVLLRPASALGTPSFASVRLLLEPLPSWRSRRRLKVEVLRCRAGAFTFSACREPSERALQALNVNIPNSFPKGRGELGVEIDDATGHVRVFSALELATKLAPSA